MPFALNLYLRLGHHLLSAIFSRIGALLTMVINYVQASSAMSKLKATRRDLTILLLYVFSKVYMTHHCNSGVLSRLREWRLINYHHHHNEGIDACRRFLDTRTDKHIPTETLCDLLRIITSTTIFRSMALLWVLRWLHHFL